MTDNLTEKEKKKFEKLKGLSRCLADYVFVIEEVYMHPSTSIQEAIDAVHYYSRQLKELE